MHTRDVPLLEVPFRPENEVLVSLLVRTQIGINFGVSFWKSYSLGYGIFHIFKVMNCYHDFRVYILNVPWVMVFAKMI